VLIAGLNPHRPADDKACNFVRLLVGQVAAGLSNANAYEAERRRAEALAEIDRAKTTFFSNVSHEFRTPLTLMLGPTEEALRSASPRIEGEDLALLHRNELRLLRLVNNLLDFVRIEAGRADASFVETDLARLTRELANAFEYAIESAGLEFLIDCPALDEPVFVDHEMWEKVVLNLLSNALKFTFEGSIAVQLRRVEHEVVLAVTDTGAGIPPHELTRMFERFHRVVGTRSRTHEGSGIGLALVHELVRMHGGRVEVESTLGKGSTFRVHVPLRPTHPQRASAVETTNELASTALGAAPFVEEALRWLPSTKRPSVPVRPDEGRGRIVVVDDNADMRDYLLRLLGEHWAVETVGDGSLALEAMRRHPPDLVLSDVMMPGLDGFALLRAVRSDPVLSRTRVVLLSARAGEEATVEALTAGADDYIVKPFVARDLLVRITARLAAANAARESAEQRTNLYRALSQAPFPIAIFHGPEMRIELANEAALRVWGKTPAVMGKTVLEAAPELGSHPFIGHLERVYRTGISHLGQAESAPVPTGPKGELRDAYITYVFAPLLDTAEKVEGVLVAAFDVTEQALATQRVEQARSEAEALARSLAATAQQLERERSLLQAVQKAAKIGVFDWDGRSNDVYWSPELYALLGRRPGEIEPTIENWNASLHPDDRGRAWEALRAAKESGSTDFQIEVRAVHPDGMTRWIRSTSHLTFENGQLVRIIGAAIDIEELKTLSERERIARIDAECASYAKDDFLAMLGHELRNPLAPIATAVHLLKLRSGDAIAREVSVIDRQVQHIARLVDDLLDVSRIARGKVVLNKESADVADLAAAAIEMVSPAIENGQHALVVKVSRGLAVDVDRGRMTQALANLLANAAKYTRAGGRITLAATRQGAEVVISVEDTGIGLSPELLPRVFDLFVQSRQTLDRAQGGLGLGLAIVKNLVAMHGGTVSADSRGVGHGSTFTVRLPAIDVTATQPQSPLPPPPAVERHQQRVLVVDDNADGADMLVEVLGGLGYRAAVAHDGPEALRVASEFVPHIALLDLGLPVMDGYELAARLREQWRDVKLVAITGYGQDRDRERTRRAGFQAHLTKPVDLEKLAKLLLSLSGSTQNASTQPN
jgi:PAS domain S-box-containing protein